MKTALTKKILILISTVLILLLISVVPMFAEEGADVFTDVTEGSWYYDHVMYAYENGFMLGVADGFFAPSEGFSRAMIVQVLYNMSGAPETAVTEAPFEDVPVGKWYTVPVAWAKENNIIAGRGNGLFDPAADITRAELCTVLNSYAKSSFRKMPSNRSYKVYDDNSDIPSFASNAVGNLYRAGIIDGKTEDTFAPLDIASRAEAATILHNFAEIAIKKNIFEKHGIGKSIKANAYGLFPSDMFYEFYVVMNVYTGAPDIPGMTVSAIITNGETTVETMLEKQIGAPIFRLPNDLIKELTADTEFYNVELKGELTFTYEGDTHTEKFSTGFRHILPEFNKDYILLESY